jgi:hypothetical protein
VVQDHPDRQHEAQAGQGRKVIGPGGLRRQSPGADVGKLDQ